jgi:hypothetical protein
MKFPDNWTTVDKLNRLQRMVLLHSIIYYDLDESVISDDYYNKLTRLLARKVERYRGTKTFKKTMYAYVFEGYTDGSTGFDLTHKLMKRDYEYLRILASHIIYRYKENQNGIKKSKCKTIDRNSKDTHKREC